MMCVFEQLDGQVKCLNCGRIIQTTVSASKVRAQCSADPTLLGNRIEIGLKQLGIPTCVDCDERKRIINEIHLMFRRSKL